MSYRLVRAFSTEGQVSLGSIEVPRTSVVEDDVSIRWLVLPGPAVSVHTWVQARQEGVQALVRRDADGWSLMLVEDFERRREERQAPRPHYLCHEGWWQFPASPIPPTYADLLRACAETSPGAPAVGGDTYVSFHTHTEYSPLDGLSRIKELVTRAVDLGMPAIGIADHGTNAGHAELQIECDEAGIKPIFGTEVNFTDDRFRRGQGKDDATQVLGDYRHLVLMAETPEGLGNLWAINNEAHRTGYYGRPRMDWDVLTRHAEGVLCSTACLRGPIAAPLLRQQDEAKARANLARLLSIFGPDRLFIELSANALPDQRLINQILVGFAYDFSLPVVVATDSHYTAPEDKHVHKVWIAAQTGSKTTDDASLFEGDADFHLLAPGEIRESLSYLPASVVDEAIRNTLTIGERCLATVPKRPTRPIFSRVGGVERDVERMREVCEENWQRKLAGKREPVGVYRKRYEHEVDLLARKQFAGTFHIVADYVGWAKQQGYLVGPGRGSGGGSLVAYLMDITEIDPVDADLLFERFMTEGRNDPPDFDVDFPSSAIEPLVEYVMQRWGDENVIRVGSVNRYKNKGVVRAVAKFLADYDLPGTELPMDAADVNAVCSIITNAERGTAGLGMKWEDLWVQFADDLGPYRQKYPYQFSLCDRMVGRLQTYGQHAAGYVISTDEPLLGRIPMRRASAEDPSLVVEFDFRTLEWMGFLKFDLLALRNLDTLQRTLEAIGMTPQQVYDWREEVLDPEVWADMAAGRTLGDFQVETYQGTKYTKLVKPEKMHDLADIVTIVRPGPERSGLTATYLRRRHGEEPVTFPDPRLEQALARTFGCILYQEDVMNTCMLLGGYDGTEADAVRKILGKKLVEKTRAAGEKFVERCAERGMDRDAAAALWAQIEEFARYSFNRAHAYGYAVIAYWCHWFKVHHPAEYMAALLSTADKDRIPEFINEAKRLGFRVLPPDINESGPDFTVVGDNVIRYGLAGIKDVGEAKVHGLLAGQPYASWEDFLARKGNTADSGVVRTVAQVGAFDSLVPNRRQLVRDLEWDASPDSTRCVHKDETVVGPNGLPCRFDWTNEPAIDVKGKPTAGKAPPKRCTRACRQYVAPDRPGDIAPFTDADIRAIEKEYLGTYLSSTPFDRIDPEDLRQHCLTAEALDEAPPGVHTSAVIITKVKPHTDRQGRRMAFVQGLAQTNVIDFTVFSRQFERCAPHLKPDRLALVAVEKNGRGYTLVDLIPL